VTAAAPMMTSQTFFVACMPILLAIVVVRGDKQPSFLVVPSLSRREVISSPKPRRPPGQILDLSDRMKLSMLMPRRSPAQVTPPDGTFLPRRPGPPPWCGQNSGEVGHRAQCGGRLLQAAYTPLTNIPGPHG